jgi:hypothetical protein
MSGIHLTCDLNGGDLCRDHRAIANAMDSLTHDERYGRHEWLKEALTGKRSGAVPVSR